MTLRSNWTLLSERLRATLPADEYTAWIAPLRVHRERDDELVLVAPNSRFVHTVEENYRALIDREAAALRDELFQIVLTRKGGFQVEVTEDPPYVLREARAGSVDLIIMDISLSNSELDGKPVDGLEITRRLKANPGTRHVPVLLATAHAMKGSREKFLRESGADDYISKPIVSAAGSSRVPAATTRAALTCSSLQRWRARSRMKWNR